MLLKDITANLLTVSNSNSTYNSDPWYLFISSRISSYIKRRNGFRPLFPWIENAANPNSEAGDAIDALFEGNAYKYRHLWELYVAKYNPIWNYDGTDEETITRALEGATQGQKKNTGTETRSDTGTQTTANTGTQTHANTGTQTVSDTGTQTRVNTGTQTVNDTGTQTANNTGTQTNAATGTDATTTGNTSTKSVTSYDSATWHDAEKTVDSGSNSTTYGKTDTRTDALQSQRTDNLQSQRTDNLTEATTGANSENETIHTIRKRGGNQGTTTTQSMEQEELAWIGAFNFMDIVAADMCNEISYCFY